MNDPSVAVLLTLRTMDIAIVIQCPALLAWLPVLLMGGLGLMKGACTPKLPSQKPSCSVA